MNEADSPSINLDELRLLPDWLREEPLPPSKQYAGHEGRDDERRGPGGDRRDSNRSPRREGGYGPRGGGGNGGGPRPSHPPGQGGRPGGGREERRGPGGDRRGGDRGPRRDDRGERAPQAPLPPVTPAPVKIEFLPESRCLTGIIKQIRTTHMAYPLFGTARMFLQEPERHLLRISLEPAAGEAATVLYQLGENGPVATDRQVLERIAYEAMKDRYYVEQTETKEPPKGNFTNVARCRLDGALLGPTNYHGYQPALRSLYENRYSRRMPFEAFRQSIEVVSDPALVEKWKGEANTVTTLATRNVAEGEKPVVLQSNADARAHFRQHYLEQLLRQGTSFELPGSVARTLPEAGMMMAIRQANEAELRYPALFVQHLRKGLQDAGLHIFKHRKRVVYVAVTRPVPFSGGAVSSNVAAILEYIGEKPNCTRKDLANQFLPKYIQLTPADVAPPAAIPEPAAAPAAPEPAPAEPVAERDTPAAETESAPTAEGTPEVANEVSPAAVAGNVPTPATPQNRAKAALAADLRFLVQAGHIIEFHNGTFDLPLSVKTKEEQQPAGRSLPKPNPLFTGKRKGEAAASTAVAPATAATAAQAATGDAAPTEESPTTEDDARGHQIAGDEAVHAPDATTGEMETLAVPADASGVAEGPTSGTVNFTGDDQPTHTTATATGETETANGAVSSSEVAEGPTSGTTNYESVITPRSEETPVEGPTSEISSTEESAAGLGNTIDDNTTSREASGTPTEAEPFRPVTISPHEDVPAEASAGAEVRDEVSSKERSSTFAGEHRAEERGV